MDAVCNECINMISGLMTVLMLPCSDMHITRMLQRAGWREHEQPCMQATAMLPASLPQRAAHLAVVAVHIHMQDDSAAQATNRRRAA